MTVRSCAEAVVNALTAEPRAAVADDPKHALESSFGLHVSAGLPTSQRGDGGWCDGVSFFDSGVVVYAQQHGRRDNFTLAHELGHLLVFDDTDALNWIADQPDPGRTLEQVCEEIAAQLLIPRSKVDEIVGDGPLRARHVADLYEDTNASRHASAIALSRRLPCEGFLATIDPDTMTIVGSARAADARPYGWRDDRVPDGHPLRHLTPGVERSTEAWWPYPDGERRAYFLDALHDGDYIYAVLAELNLWNIAGFYIPDAGRKPGYAAEFRCLSCGFEGQVRTYPHTDCGER